MRSVKRKKRMLGRAHLPRIGVSLCLLLALGSLSCGACADERPGPFSKNQSTFDARRAAGYLTKICRLGPRPSGSAGMTQQQSLLVDHFTRLGANVGYQSFDAADPIRGEPVRMSNLIVTWHPKSTERILIACHYDTRPYPDLDPVNPRGTFLGANDGASGVALLMELGNMMPGLTLSRGVDFVFFDGEELVVENRGKYFLGSTHFATQYRDHPPAYKYVAGILVDMVGDRDLSLFMEKNSVRLAPAVTRGIWETAKSLNIREFRQRELHEINDDHLPLNEIAHIPTCDIIDFDYPYWHKAGDLPQRCSGESLAKVGRVIERWLVATP